MNTLIFDTASTGFWNDQLHYSDAAQPKLVALSAILEDENRNEIDRMCVVIKPPPRYSVSEGALKYHGISTDYARSNGIEPGEAAERFISMMMAQTKRTAAYNSAGHIGVVQHTIYLSDMMGLLTFRAPEDFCIMKHATDMVKSPDPNGRGYRWPRFADAYYKAAGQQFGLSDPQSIEDGLMQKLEAIRKVYHWLLDTVPNLDKPKDDIP